MPISFRLSDYDRVHLDTKENVLTLFPRSLDWIPAQASAIYSNPDIGPKIELNIFELINSVTINSVTKGAVQKEYDLYDEDDNSDEKNPDTQNLPEYKNARYQLFVCEMRDNLGVEPFHYKGRNFYEGPAVEIDDIQSVIRATSVKCQWDNLGLDFVVYPR